MYYGLAGILMVDNVTGVALGMSPGVDLSSGVICRAHSCT